LNLDFDSSGKPGAGILQGNIWWMGAYDQCVKMEEAHFCSMTNVALVAGPNKTVLFLIIPCSNTQWAKSPKMQSVGVYF